MGGSPQPWRKPQEAEKAGDCDASAWPLGEILPEDTGWHLSGLIGKAWLRAQRATRDGGRRQREGERERERRWELGRDVPPREKERTLGRL